MLPRGGEISRPVPGQVPGSAGRAGLATIGVKTRWNFTTMPLETPPNWWDFELELSPHILDRMIDRDFSEAELRLMLEVADALRPGGSIGRWIVQTLHHGDAWEVVVEPDDMDLVIVVITAYKVSTW